MPDEGIPRRKRCKRYDEPGHAHYLTFSCFHRQPFFLGRLSPAWFLQALDAARSRERFDLWAFVIMPDHVHLLIRPGPGATISKILHAVKRPVAQRVLAWVLKSRPSFLARMEERRPSGKIIRRFWQTGGGYDRNLWSFREIHEKIAYIHANPVRRGLVQTPDAWPWSSFRAWDKGCDEPIRIDRETVPALEG